MQFLLSLTLCFSVMGRSVAILLFALLVGVSASFDDKELEELLQEPLPELMDDKFLSENYNIENRSDAGTSEDDLQVILISPQQSQKNGNSFVLRCLIHLPLMTQH